MPKRRKDVKKRRTEPQIKKVVRPRHTPFKRHKFNTTITLKEHHRLLKAAFKQRDRADIAKEKARAKRAAKLKKYGGLKLGLYSADTNGRKFYKRVIDGRFSSGYRYDKTDLTIKETIEDRYVNGFSIDGPDGEVIWEGYDRNDWYEYCEDNDIPDDDADAMWYH